MKHLVTFVDRLGLVYFRLTDKIIPYLKFINKQRGCKLIEVKEINLDHYEIITDINTQIIYADTLPEVLQSMDADGVNIKSIKLLK